MRHLSFAAVVTAGLLFAAVAVFAAPPEAASPGSATGTVVGDGCPTFSWGQVPNAEGYELVVYSAEEEKDGLPPVLVQRVAGAASSWTPSLGRCLERGGRYAWSLRAFRTKEPAEWSVPFFFDVIAGPSQAEFEKALNVVQHYLALRGETKTASPPAIQSPSFETSATAIAGIPRTAGPVETVFSVDGNVDAVSFTGDGASLGGVAKSSDFEGHTGNTSAHHSRYTDLEVIAAAGPHTVDTDTTCDGQACNGANFIAVNAATLGGLPPTAYSQGPHVDLPITTKGDLLVRTANALVRLPKGKDRQVLMAMSSAPAGVAWRDIMTSYYLDAFTELGAYWGSDGSLDWNGSPWDEDDNGGANGGSLRVVEEANCAAGNCLRLAGDAGVQIVRTADLEMPFCLSAELSLNVNNQLGSDIVRLEVSKNAGMSYSILKDYDGTNNGESADVFDFTEFISDETLIRMRVLTPGGQFIYFDNVMISCSAVGSE